MKFWPKFGCTKSQEMRSKEFSCTLQVGLVANPLLGTMEGYLPPRFISSVSPHISLQINIFTKETRNGAHFWRLQDSFMCPLSDFLQQSLFGIHLSRQQAEPHIRQVLPSVASSCVFTSRGLFLSALCSSLLSQTLEAISHLSSAGRHIIWSLHPVVPSIPIRVFESTPVGFCFFPSVLDARMGDVGLPLACFFLVVHSFKISKALTFTISKTSNP